ncbi:MAG: hypothetical protein GC190_21015 [Alphaproteobacteria bacterium]|nr:hypothetical protein [Alphaproteobacteria bacterium]
MRLVDERDRLAAYLPPRGWAYVGRSAANNPIILTNGGPFEIQSAGVDIEPTPLIVVLDEERRTVLASYPNVGGSIWIEATGNAVSAWTEHRGRCISFPAFRPGLLSGRRHGCAFSKSGGFNISSDFEPAVGTKLSSLRELIPRLRDLDDLVDNKGDGSEFGGQGWLVVPYRLRKTSIVVVHMACVDCE